MSLPPTLTSARLTLRPWRTDDVDAFHAIWGDPRVIWWGAARDRDESASILAKVLAHYEVYEAGLGWWAMVDESACVGNALLKRDPAVGEIEIGWHVARAAQRRGYATEAARVLVAHAFHTLGLRRLVATIVPDNRASIRVAEKLGMRREGTVIKADLLHDVWVAAQLT
jgi:RimJ/RimL family protein N-acetyltransferase